MHPSPLAEKQEKIADGRAERSNAAPDASEMEGKKLTGIYRAWAEKEASRFIDLFRDLKLPIFRDTSHTTDSVRFAESLFWNYLSKNFKHLEQTQATIHFKKAKLKVRNRTVLFFRRRRR
eukprot:GHVP01034484.1.p1 GENE.GHVP01034484.1~~GHVP01034484.1.p1  ORF type:complete len:120 (-),score=17.04 GHVP01034484.1:1306-1665(-)